jgi:hypothetical protein
LLAISWSWISTRGHARLNSRISAGRIRTLMAEQQPAGLSELDSWHAATSLDQAVADERLERGDLLADGGLGEPTNEVCRSIVVTSCVPSPWRGRSSRSWRDVE